jgi:hypothetical protein
VGRWGEEFGSNCPPPDLRHVDHLRNSEPKALFLVKFWTGGQTCRHLALPLSTSVDVAYPVEPRIEFIAGCAMHCLANVFTGNLPGFKIGARSTITAS